MIFIPFWILAFRFWIIKPLIADSFRNSNVAPIKQNGITLQALVIYAFFNRYFIQGVTFAGSK